MPRPGTTMSQAELKARFWGTGRFTQSPLSNNTVPRTNGDTLLAIHNTNAQFLLVTTEALSRIYTTDDHSITARTVLPSRFFASIPADSNPTLRSFFTIGGVFCVNNGDDKGITLEGVKLLKKAMILLIELNGGQGVNELVADARAGTREAEQKVERLTVSLAQQKKIVEGLQDEVRDLDRLFLASGLERPSECMNCGTKKSSVENFGGFDYTSKKVKVVSDTTKGVWMCPQDKCYGGGAVIEEDETYGGTGDFFGNTWNTCGKQDGTEGLCRDCSLDGKMLPPKCDGVSGSRARGDEPYGANMRGVGGFQYFTPTCCFHMGCAEDCGIMWNKNSLLVNQQLAEIQKINITPLQARRGLCVLTPSMVKETGIDCCVEVKVWGERVASDDNFVGTTYPFLMAHYPIVEVA